MSCISTGALRVHVSSSPPLDPQTEEQVSELWTEAARIVSGLQISQSTTTALLKRLNQNLSDLEKDEVREKLKREISSALKAGGIPPEMIHGMKMVFTSLLMKGIDLVQIEPGASIILYLICESVESLLSLRDMVLSGLLLQLFGDVIKQFTKSPSQIHVLVKAEDYNSYLSYLIGGKYVCLLSFYYKHRATCATSSIITV